MDNNAEQLSDVITNRLLDDLLSGAYEDLTVLPPETDLAMHYNVSRNIIREVLTGLELLGYISRKKGVGTLINRDVLRVKYRVDLNHGLLEAVEARGHKAEMVFLDCETVAAPRQLPTGSGFRTGSGC